MLHILGQHVPEVYVVKIVLFHLQRGKRERERCKERKKRRLVGKFGGDRKSDQDLESGLVVFDEQVRAISLVHQHANGANPKQSTHCLHNTPTHAAIKQQINTCPV